MKSIIVRMKGGMGNQMFEYACGRALQLRMDGYNLMLDLSEMKNKMNGRKYTLDIFSIPEDVRMTHSGKFDQYSRLTNPVLRIAQKFFPEYVYKIYAKKNIFIWDETDYRTIVPECSKSVFLNGYWQSSKYFKDFDEAIGCEFRFKQELNASQKRLKEQIMNTQSIAVHIRLGDYLSNKKYQVCNKEYYLKGIEVISKKIKDNTVFVFSDDIDKAKNYFADYGRGDIYYVEGNEKESIDLELMSCCKYFVISNSTFSWWAQHLSNYENKIVCAPSRWSRNEEGRSIYEDGWILCIN